MCTFYARFYQILTDCRNLFTVSNKISYYVVFDDFINIFEGVAYTNFKNILELLTP